MSAAASIRSRDFGRLACGQPVREYTLDNGAGLSLSAINLGGIVTALRVPDRHGVAGNIVLGFASLRQYEAPHPHLGTIVGRHANRVAQGQFTLDRKAHRLAQNDGPHALHGGPLGFGKRWWHITELPAAANGSVAIELSLVSEDGDQGYPGRLQVQVRYTLTAHNEWHIAYRASCDRSTVVNLTHHDYFNLAGHGNILGHRLQIASTHYCPVDAGLIPEGIAPVAGTAFDFRTGTAIGERIRSDDLQLRRATGYDHNWVLDAAEREAEAETETKRLHFAARLEDPWSGRAMEIETTEPGLQFYSGNFLDCSLLGANGRVLGQNDGLCLETQHFPDTPNHPEFPSTVLRSGETYTSSTVHRFGLC